MPIGTYMLNHYYKGFVRKSFDTHSKVQYAWQLVPDVYNLDIPERCLKDTVERSINFLSLERTKLDFYRKNNFIKLKTKVRSKDRTQAYNMFIPVFSGNKMCIHWQEIGFWHIGRSQVMMSSYGSDDFYNNDMANSLKTNHMEMTFQPMFSAFPIIPSTAMEEKTPAKVMPITRIGEEITKKEKWNPSLMLETKYITPSTITKSTAKKHKDESSNRKRNLSSSNHTWDTNEVSDQLGKFSSSNPPWDADELSTEWGAHPWDTDEMANEWDNYTSHHKLSWDEDEQSGGTVHARKPSTKMTFSEINEEVDSQSNITIKQEEVEETRSTSMLQVNPLETESGSIEANDKGRLQETNKTEEENTISLPTPGLNNKKTQARPKGRKTTGNTNVVEGTLLKPGAAAESCTIQLL